MNGCGTYFVYLTETARPNVGHVFNVNVSWVATGPIILAVDFRHHLWRIRDEWRGEVGSEAKEKVLLARSLGGARPKL